MTDEEKSLALTEAIRTSEHRVTVAYNQTNGLVVFVSGGDYVMALSLLQTACHRIIERVAMQALETRPPDATLN